MGVLRTWNTLSHLGVDPDLSPARARKIIVVNAVAVAMVLILLGFVPLNYAFLDPDPPLWLAVSQLYFVPGVVATLALNRARRHAAAVACLTATGLSVLVFLFAWIGPSAALATYIMPTIAGICLTYPSGRAVSMVALLTIVLFVFVGMIATDGPLISALTFDAEGLQDLGRANFLTSTLLVTVTAAVTRSTTVEAEQRVEQANIELKRALEQLKASQARLVESEKQAAVGRLVAGMLHEVNTPLGAIRSSSDTMCRALERAGAVVSTQADAEDRETKKALRAVRMAPKLRSMMESAIDRITSVVDGLAKFVSLDESERKAVDVPGSIDTALLLLTETLGGEIAVQRDFEERLPEVSCFPAKLNQVLLSVLQNAAEAIEDEGRITIRAKARGGRLVVEVEDTGRGIPAAELEGLFDIGFASKDGRVGMQLGLPMCKRHLAEIGGSIEVASTVGEGTVVTLAIPTGP